MSWPSGRAGPGDDVRCAAAAAHPRPGSTRSPGVVRCATPSPITPPTGFSRPPTPRARLDSSTSSVRAPLGLGFARGPREPGEIPGLPRSGEWERTPSSSTGREDREATASRRPCGSPTSPKTCPRRCAHQPVRADPLWPRGGLGGFRITARDPVLTPRAWSRIGDRARGESRAPSAIRTDQHRTRIRGYPRRRRADGDVAMAFVAPDVELLRAQLPAARVVPTFVSGAWLAVATVAGSEGPARSVAPASAPTRSRPRRDASRPTLTWTSRWRRAGRWSRWSSTDGRGYGVSRRCCWA